MDFSVCQQPCLQACSRWSTPFPPIWTEGFDWWATNCIVYRNNEPNQLSWFRIYQNTYPYERIATFYVIKCIVLWATMKFTDVFEWKLSQLKSMSCWHAITNTVQLINRYKHLCEPVLIPYSTQLQYRYRDHCCVWRFNTEICDVRDRQFVHVIRW